MAFVASILFFIPLFFLWLFLLYKTVEQIMGREFFLTRYLYSHDATLRRLIVFLGEFMFSYRGRASLFFLTRFIYPVQRGSRRIKFRINAWYFHILEGLRRRHMSRYERRTSLYLKTISSESSQKRKDDGSSEVFINPETYIDETEKKERF